MTYVFQFSSSVICTQSPMRYALRCRIIKHTQINHSCHFPDDCPSTDRRHRRRPVPRNVSPSPSLPMPAPPSPDAPPTEDEMRRISPGAALRLEGGGSTPAASLLASPQSPHPPLSVAVTGVKGAGGQPAHPVRQRSFLLRWSAPFLTPASEAPVPECLKQPEFRRLLNEYAEAMQSPEAKQVPKFGGGGIDACVDPPAPAV